MHWCGEPLEYFYLDRGISLFSKVYIFIAIVTSSDAAKIFCSCFFDSKIEDLENEIEEVKIAFEMKKFTLDR